MYAAIAILALSFLLTFFNVVVSEAEVWICSQPGGGTLFTDVPQTEGSCQKHEPVSQLNYAPPINWANVPPPDATYEWQEAIQLNPQPVTRTEEQNAVSSEESHGYNPEQSSFWSFDENPVISIYTYTYGVPYFRHQHNRDFAHVMHKDRQIPRIWAPFNATQPTPATHFREHSIRSIAPQALPQTGPLAGMRSPHSPNSSVRTVAPGLPTNSAPPALSRHAGENSVAVASGAQAHTTPTHVQGNSEVAKVPSQSSSQTSSARFREHSGEAEVHGASPQSFGFRQDTKH